MAIASKTKKNKKPVNANTANGDRSPEKRWSKKLIRDGFTPVSNFFLKHYHELTPEITHGEAMFIIHLMFFKWDKNRPRPAYKTLAKRMLIKDGQARNLARSLEVKKYLKRKIRVALPNLFDLQPLFRKLEELQDIKNAEDKE